MADKIIECVEKHRKLANKRLGITDKQAKKIWTDYWHRVINSPKKLSGEELKQVKQDWNTMLRY